MALRLYKEIGPFTPDKMAEMETDMWITKMKQKALMELVTCGSISIATMESFLSMDIDPLPYFSLNRQTALQLLNRNKVPKLEIEEIVEIEEGASWLKVISEGFEIEAPIMDDLLLETSNPKTPL
jgi:hypothetical protein